MEDKTIIGFIERVKINGHSVLAKIDTGASRNSIDLDLASRLRLGPIVKKSTIISAHGKSFRPVIKAKIVLGGKKINALFNVTSRSHLEYKVLIGKSILKLGYLIDPVKECPQ